MRLILAVGDKGQGHEEVLAAIKQGARSWLISFAAYRDDEKLNRLATAPTDEKEEWRVVLGWPDYEVSSLGRVRSWRPIGRTPKKRTNKPRMKKIWYAAGYPMVGLSYHKHEENWPVHVLMLLAFVGPKPTPKHVARHLDDIRTNNILSNLAWGTRRENRLDASRNGRQSAGSTWAKKVSKKLKGKPQAPSVIANKKKAWERRKARGWRMSQETRDRIAAKNRGRKDSTETRLKKSRARKAYLWGKVHAKD